MLSWSCSYVNLLFSLTYCQEKYYLIINSFNFNEILMKYFFFLQLFIMIGILLNDVDAEQHKNYQFLST